MPKNALGIPVVKEEKRQIDAALKHLSKLERGRRVTLAGWARKILLREAEQVTREAAA